MGQGRVSRLAFLRNDEKKFKMLNRQPLLTNSQIDRIIHFGNLTVKIVLILAMASITLSAILKIALQTQRAHLALKPSGNI